MDPAAARFDLLVVDPATPVAVELDESVGERRFVDARRYPPWELTRPGRPD